MKSLFAVFTLLLLTGSAAAREAHVFLSDHATSDSSALSPETARLVFAQRLGLGPSQTMKQVDENTIEALNKFGGRSRKLFGQDAAQRQRALIMIDGVKDVKDVLPFTPDTTADFTIPNPPSSSANADLLRHFLEYIADSTHLSYDSTAPALFSTQYLHEQESSMMIRTRTLNPDADSEAYDAHAATVRSELTKLCQYYTLNGWDWTLALMPPTPSSSGSIFTKRADIPSTWGQEVGSGRPDVLPGSLNHDPNVANPPHSPIFPEDIYVDHPNKEESGSWLDSINPWSSSDEEALDTTPAWKAPAAQISAALDYLVAANTSAPKGILPQCYSTASGCEAATHGCSGHGKCDLKYKDPESANKGTCYSCMCTPTKRTNKDGTVKTTVWSGPACQKVDVSFEFWLIGSVTVALLSVIAWGIGLLMSMGSEDLPSVIGAGVAGPRAKQ